MGQYNDLAACVLLLPSCGFHRMRHWRSTLRVAGALMWNSEKSVPQKIVVLISGINGLYQSVLVPLRVVSALLTLFPNDWRMDKTIRMEIYIIEFPDDTATLFHWLITGKQKDFCIGVILVPNVRKTEEIVFDLKAVDDLYADGYPQRINQIRLLI